MAEKIKEVFGSRLDAIDDVSKLAPPTKSADQTSLTTSRATIMCGPAFRNADVSLIRNTAQTESASLQLRAEFFNVCNIIKLGSSNTNVNDSARFGRIFATRGLPRVIQ